jgi:hypothetical protein
MKALEKDRNRRYNARARSGMKPKERSGVK